MTGAQRPANPAGRSARQRYAALRAQERAVKRKRFPVALVFVAAASVLGYVATVVAARMLVRRSGAALDDVYVHRLGLLFGALVGFNVARAVWGRRQSTEAWRVGAEGEELTAAQLAPLEAKGFVVLHDLRLPGSRANIDHVVIGPTGVFTIETKNYSGTVALTRRLFPWSVVARHRGRTLDGVVRQAQIQAAAVTTRVGSTDAVVTPVVVIQRADLTVGWFATPWTDDVRWCAGARLARTLRRLPKSLTPDDAEAIAVLLGRGLVDR
jgi:hypothetical protein